MSLGYMELRRLSYFVAVVEQRSREMIGQMGFFYGSQPLDEDIDSYPQAGWLLVPQAQVASAPGGPRQN